MTAHGYNKQNAPNKIAHAILNPAPLRWKDGSISDCPELVEEALLPSANGLGINTIVHSRVRVRTR